MLNTSNFVQAAAAAEQMWQSKLEAATQEAASRLEQAKEQHEASSAAARSEIAALKQALDQAHSQAESNATGHVNTIEKLQQDLASSASKCSSLEADLEAQSAGRALLEDQHMDNLKQVTFAEERAEQAQEALRQAELSSSEELRRAQAGFNGLLLDVEHSSAVWTAENQQLRATIAQLQQQQQKPGPAIANTETSVPAGSVDSQKGAGSESNGCNDAGGESSSQAPRQAEALDDDKAAATPAAGPTSDEDKVGAAPAAAQAADGCDEAADMETDLTVDKVIFGPS